MVAAMEVIVLSDDDDSSLENSASASPQPQHDFRASSSSNGQSSKFAQNRGGNGFRPNVSSSRIQMGGGTGTVTITEKPLDLTALFAGNSDPPKAITPPAVAAVATPPVLSNRRHAQLRANGAGPSRLSLPAKPMNFGLPNNNLARVKKSFADNTIDLSQIGESSSRKRPYVPKPFPNQWSVVPEKKRNSYVSTIKAVHGYTTFHVSEPPVGSLMSDNDEYTGQFRCTALNCDKILPNNVSFMFHMWAHVAYYTKHEYTKDQDAMSDEKFHRMCPCCWNVFENAYDRTQHYLYVHRNIFQSPNTCHICEFYDKNMEHREKVQHKVTELPFECRKCKFRTSARLGLIQHFFKVHICTTMLICPFCPFSVHITPGERNRGMAMAKGYVAHILEHAALVHRKCSSCSYKFSSNSMFEKHCQIHTTETHKYPITTKPFKDLKDEMASPRPRMDNLTLLKCVECDSLFPKAENHFGKKMKCKRCDFTTNCEQAFYKHNYATNCDPFYKIRSGLYDLKGLTEEKLKPVKIPKGYTPSVCKSKDFKQNFAMFRDFTYDRQVPEGPPPKPETEAERRAKLREKLVELTLPRKVKSLDETSAENLAQYVFEYKDKRPDTVTFVKKLRRPFSETFAAACQHARFLQESA
uniref:C2H2-type domain-containing protein n=1 Tax=Panagrellus redivivus TaxID=6233 RepID=A0A7E4ZSW0_PANRE